jgi:hypothetical protein
LYLGTRCGGREGDRSLYLLLLAKLAAEGQPIKPASKTVLEYSKLFPGLSGNSFASFAALYAELRWREFREAAEREERFQGLKGEYARILADARKPGLLPFLRRIFSLRGLAYL